MGRCLIVARILVVEDENFLAMELAWIVEDAGYSVVGPERSVEDTRQVLASKAVDLALLDVNLGGEMVFPVSKMLDTLGIPFVFITSDSPWVPAEYRHRPSMTKPLRPEALLALIPRVLAERAHALGKAPKPSPSVDHPE
jgi:DNA-binding response OmpR family regulator